MKTARPPAYFALLGLLILSATDLWSQACYIKQGDSNTWDNFSNTVATGQRFTACGSGYITQISLEYYSEDVEQLQLRLAVGEHTLQPEYIQFFESRGRGKVDIQLDTPFPVRAAETYAFSVIAPGEKTVLASMRSMSGDPYQGGSAFMETNGSVLSLMSDKLFSLTIVPEVCTISQNESDASGQITTQTASGQVFTACTSGLITQLRVNLQSVTAKRLRLQLSAGNNTLNPDYTQEFATNGPGDQFIELAYPFPVQESKQYTYTIIGIEGDGVLANPSSLSGNNYPGGYSIEERNGVVTRFAYDENFSLTIIEDACATGQSVEGPAFTFLSQAAAVGQTFVACTDGIITQVCLNFHTLDTDSVRLQLSAGAHTRRPEYTQDFALPETGDLIIKLNDPFRVAAAQPYALSVIGFKDEGNVTSLHELDNDPYPDGQMLIETGGNTAYFDDRDLTFTVTVIPDKSTTPSRETDRPDQLIRLREAFPNPSRDRITISFELTRSSRTQLVVYSADGRLISMMEEQQLPAGSYQQTVPLDHLSSGLYFYGILTDQGRLMNKFVISR